MKRLSTYTLILPVVALLSMAFPQQKQSVKELHWLLGKWERTNVRPGTTAFELWGVGSNNTLTGIGISLKGSDTTFVEKLRIEEKDGSLYYVADVRENAEPTYFKFTQMTDNKFVCENPDHDFPKMISYELKDGILTAIISDGADKKMGFFFKKID